LVMIFAWHQVPRIVIIVMGIIIRDIRMLKYIV